MATHFVLRTLGPKPHAQYPLPITILMVLPLPLQLLLAHLGGRLLGSGSSPWPVGPVMVSG